jgi:hypothetical protein
MKSKMNSFLLLCLVFMFSCDRGVHQDLSEVASDAYVLSERGEEIANEADQEITERKIIKEGNLSFETSCIKETRILLNSMLKTFQAYISEDNVYDYKDRIEHSVTVRIPADRFELFLEQISRSAKKIDTRHVSARDITEEFIDIEARVGTKKDLEKRFRELIKEASTVEDILAIEREAATLRADNESLEGRLKYLENRVSFSTLTLVFYEKTHSAFGFSSKFVRALKAGWDNMLLFLILLSNLWPFIIAALVLIFFFRKRKSRRKKKVSQT